MKKLIIICVISIAALCGCQSESKPEIRQVRSVFDYGSNFNVRKNYEIVDSSSFKITRVSRIDRENVEPQIVVVTVENDQGKVYEYEFTIRIVDNISPTVSLNYDKISTRSRNFTFEKNSKPDIAWILNVEDNHTSESDLKRSVRMEPKIDTSKETGRTFGRIIVTDAAGNEASMNIYYQIVAEEPIVSYEKLMNDFNDEYGCNFEVFSVGTTFLGISEKEVACTKDFYDGGIYAPYKEGGLIFDPISITTHVEHDAGTTVEDLYAKIHYDLDGSEAMSYFTHYRENGEQFQTSADNHLDDKIDGYESVYRDFTMKLHNFFKDRYPYDQNASVYFTKALY